MSDAHDYSTLKWIRGELDSSLEAARRSLDDYFEEIGDSEELISECIQHLHQVLGTLQMVQIYGAAMLAEEMELVAIALKEDRLKKREEAAEALMLGIIQLSDYLEKLESGARDEPILILPILNELRATRDATLFSEVALFAPALEQKLASEALQGEPNPELTTFARGVRHQYHRGLLDWFRGTDVEGGLGRIEYIFKQLEGSAGTEQVKRQFRVARAVASALRDGSLDVGSATKLLMGRVDREIKRLIDQGESSVSETPSNDLLKNLLYYTACADSSNPHVAEIKTAYDLDHSLVSQADIEAGREELQAPSQDLLNSVRSAISTDLTAIKDGVDLFIRTGTEDAARLKHVEELMHKLADTLGMVGQGELRQRLKRQADWIADVVANESVPQDQDLMSLAADILFIETSLDNLTVARRHDQWAKRPDMAELLPDLPEGEFDRLVDSVLHEASIDMAKNKEAVVSYIAAPESSALLTEVPARFSTIAGAFRILHLDDAAGLLDGLAGYVQERLLDASTVPDSDRLNAFADAVTSIEYFTEAVTEGRGIHSEILDVAKQSMEQLGVSIESPGVAEAEAEASPEEAVSEFMESPVSGELPEIEEPVEETVEPKAAVEAVPEPVPSADKPPLEDIDPEILDIFIEEAREELAVIQEYLPRWHTDHDDKEALSTFRRSFHTLKGSGRLVGAMVIGEFAWSIENMLNRVIDETISVSPEVLTLLSDSAAVLPELIDCQEQGTTPQADVDSLMDRAFQLVDPEAHAQKAEAEAEEPQEPGQEEQQELPVEVEADDGAEIVAFPGVEPEPGPEPEPEPEAPIVMDGALFDIFDAESKTHLQTLRDFIDSCSSDPLSCRIDGELSRALHTLHGSAHMAEVVSMAEVSSDMEALVNALKDRHAIADEDFLSLTSRYCDLIESILGVINAEGTGLPDWTDLHEEINARQLALESVVSTEEIAAETAWDLDGEPEEAAGQGLELDVDETLLDAGLFEPAAETMELSEEILEEGESLEEELLVGDESVESLTVEELESLGAAPMSSEELQSDELLAGDEQVESVTVEELELVEPELAEPAESDQDQLLQEETEEAPSGLEIPDAGFGETETESAWEPETEAEEPEPVHVEPESIAEELVEAEPVETEAETDVADEALDRLAEVPEEAGQEEPEEQAPEDDADYINIEADPELLEIFLEEARELLEAAQNAFQNWQQNPSYSEPVADLERTLHTLKGGARLSGAMPVGDLSHAFESLLTGVDHARIEPTSTVFDLSQQVIDRLAEQVEELGHGPRLRRADDLVGRLEEVFLVDQAIAKPLDEEAGQTEVETTESLPEEGAAEEFAADETELMQPEPVAEEPGPLATAAADETAPVPDEGKADAAAPARTFPSRGREKVRVKSELLDRLVNNAGEVSIYRSRLEQQNGDLGFNLSELEQTVERLREQLRHLEIETEAQILFRYDKDKEEGREIEESFDPLELDRFSTMQQLSRSLMETVNDLANINGYLSDQHRETETLLLQQSRLTTDLQDGLMRTRMVPFAQLVPRLHRVVRQTCNPVGKKAVLEVEGAEGELDRGILDRMVGPLEHILRNSVSHGIERPEKRAESGKTESGRIQLKLQREGNDVLLTVSDDGAGMKIDLIRQKAIERGMLDPAAEVTDNDVLQFVLEHGFSTADEITQIAGRGVGLDVVVSEVKQLGGSLDIQSKPGEGTSFIIRLPLTLAISDALMVELENEIFAIPHVSIEGVVRSSYQEMQACYSGQQKHFSYAGQDYQVRYLGNLLGVGQLHLSEQRKWYPLLLIRAGEHRVALHVDNLIGNRQIVVKSVGQQLSTVRWISGGTILGDGRVALILDVTALVRMDVAHTAVAAVETVEEDREPVFGRMVMVVDDSITVRKVTGRLLERHGMHVVTAKDGVDAVAQLQDHRPDIMLLDIEMPRMDGYELARHMRNSEALRDIPIIMITSRTGDKHRNLAMELGVKRYLGKPYQESELLENINSVLLEVAE
ncbi:MAG: Hpt domain-containing protein [Candidatus Sedimenticola sp. 6PFRAG7]